MAKKPSKTPSGPMNLHKKMAMGQMPKEAKPLGKPTAKC